MKQDVRSGGREIESQRLGKTCQIYSQRFCRRNNGGSTNGRYDKMAKRLDPRRMGKRWKNERRGGAKVRVTNTQRRDEEFHQEEQKQSEESGRGYWTK